MLDFLAKEFPKDFKKIRFGSAAASRDWQTVLEGVGTPKRDAPVQVGIGLKPVSYLGTERLVYSAMAYAIANNLPYHLVTNSLINDKNSPQLTSDFFFTGGTFSDHAVLLGWQYVQAPQIIRALLASYSYGGTPVPDWSPTDYDSVWTVKIDAEGNLSVDNTTCEGIDSTRLPVTAPQF